jgi:hypothetical protein
MFDVCDACWKYLPYFAQPLPIKFLIASLEPQDGGDFNSLTGIFMFVIAIILNRYQF